MYILLTYVASLPLQGIIYYVGERRKKRKCIVRSTELASESSTCFVCVFWSRRLFLDVSLIIKETKIQIPFLYHDLEGMLSSKKTRKGEDKTRYNGRYEENAICESRVEKEG
jgi:hypothetical protein